MRALGVSSPSVLAPGLSILMLCLVAGALGAVVATGSMILTLLAAAAVGGALLLFVPSTQLAWGQLLLSFVVSGVVMYYGKVGQAHWMPYALATWMWLKLALDRAMPPAGPAALAASVSSALPPSAFTWCFLAWLTAGAVTSVANASAPLSVVVGARSHLFIWSLAFVLASGVLGERGLHRASMALVWIAALQLPFAVQQHFMNFGTVGSWDAVVGTFGGDPEGGGASGAMVIYQCIALGLLASLARHRVITPRPALALGLAVLGSIALAEVKAFFVFAPLMLAGVFWQELRERPARALVAALAAALVLGSLLLYYKHAYFDAQQKSAQEAGVVDYLDYMTSADSRLKLVNRYTGEVSRLGAPLLWAEETAVDGMAHQLTGYGLRASRTGGLLGAGEAARRFRFNLTTSAVTVLLWETGVLGLAAFLALLGTLALTARRLGRDPKVPLPHRAVQQVVPSAVAVLAASMLYNDAVVNHYTIQTLLAFLAGHTLYWRRAVALEPVPAGEPRIATGRRGRV